MASKYTNPDAHSIPLLSSTQPDDEERQPLDSSPHLLYPPINPPRRPVLNRYSWIVAATLLIIFIGLLAIPKPDPHNQDDVDFDDGYDETGPIPDVNGICAQPTMRVFPDDELTRELALTLESEEYLRESVERLSGAVQCRTESFDDMGVVGEDPRWEVFREFHE